MCFLPRDHRDHREQRVSWGLKASRSVPAGCWGRYRWQHWVCLLLQGQAGT